MYKFKEEKATDVRRKIKQKYACEVIGLTRSALSNILNRKVACRKVVAYCIVKYLDKDAEIEDYFEPLKGE